MGDVFKSFADLAAHLSQPQSAVLATPVAGPPVASPTVHATPATTVVRNPHDVGAAAAGPLTLRLEELEAREAAVSAKETALDYREQYLRRTAAALKERIDQLGDVGREIAKLRAKRVELENTVNAYRIEGICKVDSEIQRRRASADQQLESKRRSVEQQLAVVVARRDAVERECGTIADSRRAIEAMRKITAQRETELEAEDRALKQWRAELTDFQKDLLRLEKSLKPRDAGLKEREKRVVAAEQRHAKARSELRETRSALDECLELRKKAERQAESAKRVVARVRAAESHGENRPRWSPAHDNLREALIFSSDGMALESPIHRMGYAVGISGLTQGNRRKILDAAWSGKLPTVQSSSYMAEWGKPVSRRRLARIAHHLAWLVRFNGAKPSMREAVADWAADLKWLKNTYYEAGMNFSWPKI